MANPTLVWFRQDLRVGDNPALQAALEKKVPIIPLFVWAPQEEKWPPGTNSRWWLHHSLLSLQEALAVLGLKLILRTGSSQNEIQKIVQQTKADSVFWNRRYEPWTIERDATIKAALAKQGLSARSFNGSLLFEPGSLSTKQGKPFQVFTPFWNCCLKQPIPSKPLPSPAAKSCTPYLKPLYSQSLEDLKLLSNQSSFEGIEETWRPGEGEAKQLLQRFVKQALHDYPTLRDYPAVPGVSRLSPYLHHGEISPQTIWHACQSLPSCESYLRQLGWREFAHYLLYHFPQTFEQPLRSEFTSFPWNEEPSSLKKWQQGLTGYPIVDAGMRELLLTGGMHNRVRMVVSSFLVKDLMLPWLEGAKWFWEKLVDADAANNTLGWQWVSGCGADAAPYFRIFNPVAQGEKFDPEGIYVRKWIPELRALPNAWIHRPWETPNELLAKSHVVLGKTYPFPIVDHGKARLKALAAFKSLRKE